MLIDNQNIFYNLRFNVECIKQYEVIMTLEIHCGGIILLYEVDTTITVGGVDEIYKIMRL